jgi:hypothetical protein
MDLVQSGKPDLLALRGPGGRVLDAPPLIRAQLASCFRR